MVTIAHLVKKSIADTPFLEEALRKGLVNYAAIAEDLQPQIEKELGKKIKTSAVMMALRRVAEVLPVKENALRKLKFQETDLTIKSDLFEITVRRSATMHKKIQQLYAVVDSERGDFLTVTSGIHELTILCHRKYQQQIQKLFQEERVVRVISPLASLTVHLPKEAVETVGVIYALTKVLAWEGVNLVEIVSTLSELTFILEEGSIPKAFRVMKEFVGREK